MSVKAILILCAQALLIKSAFSQFTSCSGLAAPYGLAAPALAGSCGLAGSALAYDGLAYPGAGFAGRGLAYDGLNAGYGNRGLAYDGIYAPAMEFTATSGGALPVSSASAIAPVGISVMSDNVYEGALTVGGELPWVGTVALEGVVPSAGAGAVNHACGNGRNAMISETSAFGTGAYGPATAIAPAAALGAAAPFGYGAGLGGLGYGAELGGLAYPAAGLAGSAYGLGLRGGCGCGL